MVEGAKATRRAGAGSRVNGAGALAAAGVAPLRRITLPVDRGAAVHRGAGPIGEGADSAGAAAGTDRGVRPVSRLDDCVSGRAAT